MMSPRRTGPTKVKSPSGIARSSASRSRRWATTCALYCAVISETMRKPINGTDVEISGFDAYTTTTGVSPPGRTAVVSVSQREDIGERDLIHETIRCARDGSVSRSMVNLHSLFAQELTRGLSHVWGCLIRR